MVMIRDLHDNVISMVGDGAFGGLSSLTTLYVEYAVICPVSVTQIYF